MDGSGSRLEQMTYRTSVKVINSWFSVFGNMNLENIFYDTEMSASLTLGYRIAPKSCYILTDRI